MSSLRVLRMLAIAMAGVALVDPAVHRMRRQPPAVDLRIGTLVPAAGDLRSAADEVEQRLRREIGRNVAFDADAPPSAHVVIGDDRMMPGDQDNAPSSTVTISSAVRSNVRVVAVRDPGPVPMGWTAELQATIEASGRAGTTSVIAVEENGTEIARTERRWSEDRERVDVTLPYAPAREGMARISVRVRSSPSETIVSDNTADVAVTATGRRLKILVHEPRPSWAAAFVRRALESNPTFEIAAATYSSHRIAVRAGAPPATLSTGSLDAYDAVIVGAPESLTAAEVSALDAFARVRGGTIVFLPDRRPSGPYRDLLGRVEFDEVLVEHPLAVQTTQGTAMRASELAVPRQDLPDADIVASIELQRSRRPLVYSRPLGGGAVILSGALDAWRYRAQPAGGFTRFWQGVAARAALASPPRIKVELEPSIASPGEEVIVRVRVRRTELQEGQDRIIIPPISARVVGSDGSQKQIRLWPSADQGVFEGRLAASAPGKYDVHVSGGRGNGDAVLISASSVRASSLPRDAQRSAATIAASTGGVVVESDDLEPLARHLRSLPQSERRVVLHPARSWGFVTAFAAALCAEWLLRRKRGLA